MIKRAALAAAGLVVGVGVAAGVSEAAIGPVSQLTTAHVTKAEPLPAATEELATATPAPQQAGAPSAPGATEPQVPEATVQAAPTAEPEPGVPDVMPSPAPTTGPGDAAAAPETEVPSDEETPAGTGASAAGPEDTFDEQMVALVNAERDAAGVAPLQYWDGLRAGALQHSTWMDGNDFQHASDARIDAEAAAAGCSGGWAENIYWASDTGTSPEAAMRSYMDSPGHRANILNPDLRFVATGTVTTDGGLFNTQRFGYTCG
ncbi:CAP domain-containing protein [Georgenia sp. SUBG003]|uniref:CAP domain-containing protein n=1 Tax=Georgenia sp. SUBG003 TaxID=1497974 RepID=UPI0004D87673|nr:hypothetical protein DA06_21960 [Georgenia sp. SUBG003]